MQTHGNISLENHKLFPYIAWSVFIGFALFTGSLVFNLYQTVEAIGHSDQRTKYQALQAELES
jgi:uncharacterized membrane protein YgdD (TMEM256/DUF423 family)